jgi:hypothetical protein
MGKLGRIARKLVDPLVDVPTLPGGRFGRFIERGLEELSSPVSLASIAAAPFTGGGSLAARGALAGRFAPALGRGLLKGAGIELAAGLGAAGASNLAEAAGAPAPVRLLAGLAGGIAAPGSLTRGGVVRRGLRNVDEKGVASAIKRADPTASARASSPDFEVVGRGVGRSPNFQLLKPSPGKSPSDVLSRLPEKSELIIEPQRVGGLEDNLPALQVWEQFAPDQRYRERYRDGSVSTSKRGLAAMKGAGDPPRNPQHPFVYEEYAASHNLGQWWLNPQGARYDLNKIDENFRAADKLTSRSDAGLSSEIMRELRSDEAAIDAWRTTYRAGQPMRDALRKASGSDEIVLYRGQDTRWMSPDYKNGLPQPPQNVEGYSAQPHKAAAFGEVRGLLPEQMEDISVLVRRVKIDDIVGTLGEPYGTSEFVVLNPMTLSTQTMEAITGRVTKAPLRQSRVDLEQIAGKLRDVAERSRRGEFRGGLR